MKKTGFRRKWGSSDFEWISLILMVISIYLMTLTVILKGPTGLTITFGVAAVAFFIVGLILDD